MPPGRAGNSSSRNRRAASTAAGRSCGSRRRPALDVLRLHAHAAADLLAQLPQLGPTRVGVRPRRRRARRRTGRGRAAGARRCRLVGVVFPVLRSTTATRPWASSSSRSASAWRSTRWPSGSVTSARMDLGGDGSDRGLVPDQERRGRRETSLALTTTRPRRAERDRPQTSSNAPSARRRRAGAPVTGRRRRTGRPARGRRCRTPGPAWRASAPASR